VPSLNQIPLLTLRSLSASDWNQQSPVGQLLARSPQDFVNRIYDIPHDVSYALVSALLSVEPTTSESNIKLVVNPTPASDQVEALCTGMIEGGQLSILNTLGQVVLSRTIPPAGDVNSMVLDVHTFPAGSYIIQLSVRGSVRATAPLLIVR